VTTRATFLEGVRRAVGAAGVPAPPRAHGGAPETAGCPGEGHPDAGGPGRLDTRFEEAATQVGAVVHRAEGPAAAAEVVARLAGERGVRRAVAWSDAALGELRGVAARLAEAGVAVAPCPAGAATAEERAAFREAAAAADLGLTGADLGLAASGSVLLRSGPGRARSVSLLPPLHVALLRRDGLVPGLAETVAALAAWSREPGTAGGANLVLVTGPSRTADIELILTRGVHGPRELHVVLVG
jgi:L-lactate utilization protein LutC